MGERYLGSIGAFGGLPWAANFFSPRDFLMRTLTWLQVCFPLPWCCLVGVVDLHLGTSGTSGTFSSSTSETDPTSFSIVESELDGDPSSTGVLFGVCSSF